MLILLNITRAVAFILNALVTVFLVVLFVRVIISWIRVPYNQIIHVIYQLTEPVLRPVRKWLPLSWGIDLSPMIVWIALMVFKFVVIDTMSIWAESEIARYPFRP